MIDEKFHKKKEFCQITFLKERLMSKKKTKQRKIEEITFPINGSKALRIALEDTETYYFIKTNFSYPEQKPEIMSHKWISRNNSGYRWNVEIIEKIRLFFSGESEMINVAFVEIDSFSGKIMKREFFLNIFLSEYKDIKIRDSNDIWEEEN